MKLSVEQKQILDQGFLEAFGSAPERYFSAPGRTEISGNHTDHQRGRVLAAAVDLDMVAAVRENGTDEIRVQSEGYPLCCVNVKELFPKPDEVNTTAALVRGVAARFVQLYCPVFGFDVYIRSAVLPGSGLSSSAAFEVLMGTIVNCLFYGGKATPAQVAMIGQYAENVFFGKPCGLMDQMACSVGGMVTIDFEDQENPVVTPVDFDFATCGYALCIIDSRASHADLTNEYAAIPGEIGRVCAWFGKQALRQIPEAAFYENLPALREACGDRAVTRCIHFYRENARVPKQVAALRAGDFDTFLEMEKQSGYSSYMYLQNVIPAGCTQRQDVAVTLALCEGLLRGRGACRVHGGGFAGTVQAFVPLDLLESFRAGIDGALGEGACHVLTIRKEGGIELTVE